MLLKGKATVKGITPVYPVDDVPVERVILTYKGFAYVVKTKPGKLVVGQRVKVETSKATAADAPPRELVLAAPLYVRLLQRVKVLRG